MNIIEVIRILSSYEFENSKEFKEALDILLSMKPFKKSKFKPRS